MLTANETSESRWHQSSGASRALLQTSTSAKQALCAVQEYFNALNKLQLYLVPHGRKMSTSFHQISEHWWLSSHPEHTPVKPLMVSGTFYIITSRVLLHK